MFFKGKFLISITSIGVVGATGTGVYFLGRNKIENSSKSAISSNGGMPNSLNDGSKKQLDNPKKLEENPNVAEPTPSVEKGSDILSEGEETDEDTVD